MNRLVPSLLLAVAALWPATVPGQDWKETVQATSLLGKPLVSPQPSADLLDKLREREAAWRASPDDADALIWFARFQAYCGNYSGSIDTFTEGIAAFPDDPRMLRHRGHRYITVRQLDRAVADLQLAARMIEGQPDQTEPDGMPNPRNIPVSTLHSNIYYHLALANYLNHDLEAAADGWQRCLDLKINDDNRVSATHWLYMTLRRLGRDAEARELLEPIDPGLDVIENMAYHRACLFYRGEISEDELTGAEPPGTSPSGDAAWYAAGNWRLYSGNQEEGVAVFRQIVDGGLWASFGHIAAEADLARFKASDESDR